MSVRESGMDFFDVQKKYHPVCYTVYAGRGKKLLKPRRDEEVPDMQGMTWKETFANLVKEFRAWGCPYSRKQLPEIALGYDCTSLFFWNWMDDEEPRTETGFLRVLGYAWRKYLQLEAADPKPGKAAPVSVKTPAGKAA